MRLFESGLNTLKLRAVLAGRQVELEALLHARAHALSGKACWREVQPRKGRLHRADEQWVSCLDDGERWRLDVAERIEHEAHEDIAVWCGGAEHIGIIRSELAGQEVGRVVGDAAFDEPRPNIAQGSGGDAAGNAAGDPSSAEILGDGGRARQIDRWNCRRDLGSLQHLESARRCGSAACGARAACDVGAGDSRARRTTSTGSRGLPYMRGWLVPAIASPIRAP